MAVKLQVCVRARRPSLRYARSVCDMNRVLELVSGRYTLYKFTYLLTC